MGDGRGFLVPSDARKDKIASTALPVAELRHALRNSEARIISLILDACFAAGVKSISKGGRKKASDITDNIVASGSGHVSLFSSRDNESSQESDRCRHGYFTCNLLIAWNHEALRAAEQVYSFVYKQVIQETKNSQHPRKDYDSAEGSVPTY